MKISQFLPALAVAAAIWMSPALAEDSAQTFVDKAAVGGLFEVEFEPAGAENVRGSRRQAVRRHDGQ